MADIDVSLEELLTIRERLIDDINSQMTPNERQFLLSVKNMKPDFSLLQLEDPSLIASLPSVRWEVDQLIQNAT